MTPRTAGIGCGAGYRSDTNKSDGPKWDWAVWARIGIEPLWGR